VLFVAGAVAGGLIATESQRGSAAISPEIWRLGGQTTYLVLNVYAMRMAGAFTITTTTIGLRLGILPRWLAVLGWVVAIVLCSRSNGSRGSRSCSRGGSSSLADIAAANATGYVSRASPRSSTARRL
jgi:hypothetical protein